MKKILLLFLIALFSINLNAQEVKKLTIDNIFKKYTFYAYRIYGLRSMNDGETYTQYLRRDKKIVKYKYETGKAVDTIVDLQKLGINIDDYHFNHDESIILFETNSKSIYRRSYTADYYVYYIHNKKLQKLSENGSQQVASFSPNGKKVAFVRKNNIFIKDLKSNKETQITTDGEHNKIINGIPDWVYEEEYEFNKAYEWMPDSKRIAYIKFDESKVKLYGMKMFAGQAPKIEKNKLYPDYFDFKYPKAGEANSKVSVHVYNLRTGKTKKMDIGNETEIYIPRIRTTKYPENLAIFKLNRLQNKFEILFADVIGGKSNLVLKEENKYYFDEGDLDNIKFLKKGNYFVMTSERDGYRHLYLHNFKGEQVRQLTKGTNEVTKFYGYNSDTKEFYYQAVDSSPLRRAVFKVDFEGKKVTKLSQQSGTNDAVFSKTFKYFINTFSSAKRPVYVSLHDANGKQIGKALRNNDRLIKISKEYGCTDKEFFKIKTSEGVELNAYMVKPQNFDENKKYPVIIHQYSGPASQQVLDNRGYFLTYTWEQLLAQKGAIVVEVDPRGTGARGEKFRKVTYLQLGKYETIDLIEAAKYLKKLPYVKADKIGIWGWSYGGFMASLCMTKGADEFAAGIAVAPVTNWRYYDNIYTERFMRTPQENPDGYDNNSPINFADKLKAPFLLMHGSADDNVHLQNTAEFSEALVQANKWQYLEQFIYTNRNHGIRGGNTSYFLYSKMLKFWQEHLELEK